MHPTRPIFAARRLIAPLVLPAALLVSGCSTLQSLSPFQKKEAPPVDRPLDAGPLPHRMFIECTAACNISCEQACCAPETGIARTRQAGMLDFDLFRRVIDEVGPTLGRIDFFNYGEAFLHKRAVEMCEYIKTHHPHIYLYTSTNGGAFTEESARRLVHSGIDEVTFSIDGATPESYVQYRGRGKFDVAMRNLRVRWCLSVLLRLQNCCAKPRM